MGRAKLAITLDEETVRELDRLVAARLYPNRSRAIEAAVDARLQRASHRRLVRECAKLDVAAEQALAKEGLARDATEWPEY